MLGRRKGGGPGGGGTRRSIVRQGTAIFAAVLACFIAIQAFFIYTYYRTMRAHVLDTLQVLADQYGGALRYELEALHTSCISLFRDEDVTGLLRLGRGAGRELEEGARRELEAMMGLNGTVRAAYLLDNRHRIVAGVQRSSLPAAEADDLCRRAAAEALGGDGPGEGRYSLVFPAAGGESALFSVVQPIPYRPGFALDEPLEVREQAVVVGYAVLLCELRFTEAERPGGPNRFDYVYAVHSGGRMVYCSDRARWDALSAREDGGGDLYAAVCTLEQGGWTVTAAASRRDIAGLLRHTAASIGAALLAEDGRVFTGCNVENAAYGNTLCAERTALVKAVSEGCRRFTKIAIASAGSAPYPCGACRQSLYEFAPELEVLVTWDGNVARAPLGELLPHGFGPSSLGK